MTGKWYKKREHGKNQHEGLRTTPVAQPTLRSFTDEYPLARRKPRSSELLTSENAVEASKDLLSDDENDPSVRAFAAALIEKSGDRDYLPSPT